jgi:hypothetical protein
VAPGSFRTYLIDYDRAYCNDRLKPRADNRGADGILSKTAFLALPWDRQCSSCARRLFWESGPQRSRSARQSGLGGISRYEDEIAPEGFLNRF